MIAVLDGAGGRPGNAAIPVSLALTFVAGVASVVGRVLRARHERIEKLERSLKAPE